MKNSQYTSAYEQPVTEQLELKWMFASNEADSDTLILFE